MNPTVFQGQSLTIDDFELITVIGKGSFGKVDPCFRSSSFSLFTFPHVGHASQKA